MTITAQDILTELGHRAWSGFNSDDMVFGTDESLQACAELNAALRYLINLRDFPFKAKEESLLAVRNNATYTTPEGQITNIYNADTLESLVFIGDSSTYDKKLKGKPTGYWIEPNNPSQSIRLFPIPDNKYNYRVVYNQYKPVMDNEGNTRFKFEKADDFINMPEPLSELFFDCLVLRTMVTNNNDDQDENYAPIVKEFEEFWRVFVKASKPAKVEYRVVW